MNLTSMNILVPLSPVEWPLYEAEEIWGFITKGNWGLHGFANIKKTYE